MRDVASAAVANELDDVAVETCSADGSEKSIVRLAEVERTKSIRFENLYDMIQAVFLVAKFVCEEIFCSAGDQHHWLIAAFKAVNDFADRTVASSYDDHGAIEFYGGFGCQRAGVRKGFCMIDLEL
ncbi:MAG: hypothetical protein BWY69_00871 [Planctomycetes bacterium ADurb.Bin401]|nr:MAG: hypothetical protein BWY69_00871 [Planctomycetes bacterium ADurb.Bin401]